MATRGVYMVARCTGHSETPTSHRFEYNGPTHHMDGLGFDIFNRLLSKCVHLKGKKPPLIDLITIFETGLHLHDAIDIASPTVWTTRSLSRVLFAGFGAAAANL